MKFLNLLAMAAATVFVIASSAAFADGDVKKGSKVFKFSDLKFGSKDF